MRIDAVTYNPLKQRFTDLLTVQDLEAYFMNMSNHVQTNQNNERSDTIIKMLKYALANTKNVDLINTAVDILHKDTDLSECYRFLIKNKYFKRYAIDRIKQKDLNSGTVMLCYTIEYDDADFVKLHGAIIISNLLRKDSKIRKVGDVLYHLSECYKFNEDELYDLINKYKDGSYSLYAHVTPNLFARMLKGQKNIHMKYMYSNRGLFTESNVDLMSKYIDNIRPYDFSKFKETGIFSESRFREMIGDKYYLLKNYNHYYVYSKEEIETIVYKYPKYTDMILESVKHEYMDEELCKTILINIKKKRGSFFQVDFITTLVTWPKITEDILNTLITMKNVQTILLDSDFRANRYYSINQHCSDILNKNKQAVIDGNLRLLFHISKYMDMKSADYVAVIDSFLCLKKSKAYFLTPSTLGSILKNRYSIDEDVIRYMFKMKYSDFNEAMKTLSNSMIHPSYALYLKCKKNNKKMNKYIKDVLVYLRSLS